MHASTKLDLARRLYQPSVPRSDAELVLRALQRDRDAVDQLYRRHVDAIMRIALRFTGCASDAADIAHDAFLQAFTRLHQLREAHRFRAWLTSITLHEARRHFRRRQRLTPLHPGQLCERSSERAPDARVWPTETQLELAALGRALIQLPAGERRAWQMRYVEGFELREVADACSTSLATIKRWLARAQLQLHGHSCPRY